jgi:hypothetical protein
MEQEEVTAAGHRRSKYLSSAAIKRAFGISSQRASVANYS